MVAAGGQLRNLDGTLRDLLAAYSPDGGGVEGVAPGLQVSLPIPGWAEWVWHERIDSPSVAAGNSDILTLWTVPEDERVTFDSIRLIQQSGDNLIARLRIKYPTGYWAGSATTDVLYLTTAADKLFWPDYGGQQTVDAIVAGPVHLEPGSLIQMDPSGAGSAATVFRAWIRLTRCKLCRAQAP